MNPWRLHPAIVGLPIPGRYLPRPESWSLAYDLGLTQPDGAGTPALAMAANPDPDKAWKWSGGPTPWSEGMPPYDPTGPLSPPTDATNSVYKWLTRQATLRLEDVKAHIRHRRPSIDELAYKYTTPPGMVQKWIAAVRKIGVNNAVVQEPEPFNPKKIKVPKGVTYFMSGSEGSPGEVEGAARLAKKYSWLGIGIEVGKCREGCRLALKLAAKKKVPVFVDSGAYPEFECLKGLKKGADRNRCLIGPSEWRKRLQDYEVIARLFKSRTNLVAPDMIGSQAETERRLNDYGSLLRNSAHSHKAWILLVAQGGRIPRHVFWEGMRRLLVSKGIPKNKIVAALPFKEKSFTIPELRAFTQALGKRVGRYHLLGKGPLKERSFHKIVEIIWESNPLATITCDSALIASGVARGEDPSMFSVVPRVYTYAQDIVRYEVMHEAFQRSYRGGETMEGWVQEIGWGDKEVPGYSDNITEVDFWLPERYRLVLGNFLKSMSQRGLGARFGDRELDLLLKSVEDWLQSSMHPDDPGGPKWYDDVNTEAWLDDQWTRFLGSWFSARIKRDAMCKAWRSSLHSMRELVPGIDEKINLTAFGGYGLGIPSTVYR